MDNLTKPKCIKCPKNSISIIQNSISNCISTMPHSYIGHNTLSVIDVSISNEIKTNLPNDTFLLNPCKTDAITGKYVENAMIAKTDDNIYYCVSTGSNVITINSDDDYLTNNNGSYANGVIEIS